MACISKSVGNSCQGKGESEEESYEAPANSLSCIEESIAGNNVPADLEMHGERPYEDCMLR
jgi:hypothetical protein